MRPSPLCLFVLTSLAAMLTGCARDRTDHAAVTDAAPAAVPIIIAPRAVALTRGADGSTILAGGQRHDIPCVQAEDVVDPTGCGDAYRAGLLYGISRGWDWPSTGRLGALLGAIKIGYRGAQNHAPSRAELEERFRDAFGYSPWKG